MSKYLAELEASLTRNDWQYIELAVSKMVKQGNKNSIGLSKPLDEDFKQKSMRIMNFLQVKAYGQE